MIENGALLFPDGIDTVEIDCVARKVLGVAWESVNTNAAANFINTKGQRLIGKQVGKRLARSIAVILATKITKKIMTQAKNDMRVKRRLTSIRKSAKQGRGGLGAVMFLLLKANGWAGVAAQESRQLNQNCPTLWRRLRNDMGGYDMILFLIKGYIKEYLDRLAVLEKNPALFISLMAALIRTGRTQEIFFPR
ncbi:MAG: hypothetical protein ACRBCS_07925 [Cellvibrionaceae bacterium]